MDGKESIARPDAKKISRGLMLKGLGAVVAAAAVPGQLSKEIQTPQNGIETASGVFLPLLEKHDRGLTENEIPSNLTFFFRELMGSNLYSMKPEELLGNMNLIIGENTANDNFAFLLQKFAANNTKIMYGDVMLGNTMGEMVQDWSTTATVEGIGGAVAAMLLGTQKIFKRHNEKSSNILHKLGRRKLVQGGLATIAAWGLLPAATVPAVANLAEVDRNSALLRIMERLHALQSHAHPEQAFIFFRNAMMADKLLSVAEDFQQQSGKKANIGFEVGALHSGIEDFLRLGPDFCRFIISNYPSNFLKRLEETNGSLQNVCTTRIFTLPTDFQASELFQRYGDVVYKEENGKRVEVPKPTSRIKEAQVIDSKLKDMLEAKISTRPK